MSATPFQGSLFEEPDNGGSPAASLVEVVSQAKPKDKQQATFQRLIKQIHEHREIIETWQAYSPRYNQRVSSKLMPLYARLREKRIAMVHLLNEQFHQRGAIRGKRQRQNLRDMILDLTRDLLAEEHDDALVAMHDQYSDIGHAEAAELDNALSRDLVENIFGVDLEEGADDDASMEELIARAAQRLQQEAAQRAEKRATRPKSAKTIAAEEKRAEAEKAVSQSVREIYRKLASALHPDRASSELSPEEKTALMQRVNRAYDSGNLLELLNIQLEIEQIDADHLANLSAARVTHYIRVLRDQLDELKMEIEMLTAPYRHLMPYVVKIQPAHVDLAVDGEAVRLASGLRQLEEDLVLLADPRQLSAVIKDYASARGPDELTMLNDLMDVFSMTEDRPPRRRR